MKNLVTKMSSLAFVVASCGLLFAGCASAGDSSGAATGEAIAASDSALQTLACPRYVVDAVGWAQCTSPYAVNECGDNCAQTTGVNCLACEKANSNFDGTLDCGSVAGNATGGPQSGTPRAKLCRQATECLRTTSCGKNNTLACYCGTAGTGSCFSGGANGVCKAVIEASLETTSPSLIAARFNDTTYGGGLALLRDSIDQEYCKSDCFH